MINDSVAQPVVTKAVGYGRGRGRARPRLVEEVTPCPSPIGTTEQSKKAPGRGRARGSKFDGPVNNGHSEDSNKYSRPLPVKNQQTDHFRDNPPLNQTNLITNNSFNPPNNKQSSRNNQHTADVPQLVDRVSQVVDQSNSKFNTPSLRKNNTSSPSNPTSPDTMLTQGIKDIRNNMEKLRTCPADPKNPLGQDYVTVEYNPSPKSSPYDSKNRAVGRSKYASPAFRPMTTGSLANSPRGNLLPNGVQPALNFTYTEPHDKGKGDTSEKGMAITWLTEGKHILDPTLTGEVHYHPKFYNNNKADKHFHMLMGTLPFKKAPSKVGKDGKVIVHPRICLWFGPEDHPYSYSFVTLEPQDFDTNSVLKKIKQDMEFLFKTTFNSCLVNLYRDNHDSCGWRAEDEVTLGADPTIVSVSFGETRRFEFCRKTDIEEDRKAEYGFYLEHGSALLIKGDVQSHWMHSIPREYHDRKPRLNLTFRTIHVK